MRVRGAGSRRDVRCVRRSVLQQEERHPEYGAAQDCGDAEAPPLSALFPQGSTLLWGQCTRVDTDRPTREFGRTYGLSRVCANAL
jgi:hypothetical protein